MTPTQNWTKCPKARRDQGCCVHENPADCSEGFQAHHVVPQQVLRASGRPDAVWSVSSGMGVCGLAHRQHHARVRPIRLAEVPVVCREYLTRHGFTAYLERHYD